MTKQEIYAEILTALSALKDTEAAEYWQKCLSKENHTGKSIRKSVIFSDDAATVLYALKTDLERDMQAEQARKNGRKNYAAVSRFMKKCHDRYLFSKPALSVAHERDGRFFLCTPYVFYLSNHSEGLIFAPDDRKKELEKDIDGLYDNIANHFDTNGTAYKIPYTIAQLKAWKKSNGKLKIPFSVGYALPLTQQGEQHYAAVNIDYLIMAMEITGSDTLLTNDKYHLAMENADGDRVGMMCVRGTSPEFQKI